MNDRPKIGKVDVVVAHLEAAIFLSLKDFEPVPIHSLISASRTILYDLHKVEPNPVLTKIEASVERLVKPEHASDWRKYENKAANFFKHADNDPFGILEGVNISGINSILLPICILAVGQHLDKLSVKLLLGFIHFGFLNEKWMDFKGICDDYGIQDYPYYKSMPDSRRKQLVLDAFEFTHRN